MSEFLTNKSADVLASWAMSEMGVLESVDDQDDKCAAPVPAAAEHE